MTALLSFLLAAGSLHGGQPPAELAHGVTRDRIQLVDDGHAIEGSAGYDLNARRVWVTYVATGPGLRPRAEGVRTLEERTAFWPTAVAVLDDEHVAVAGRYSEPDTPTTVVEVWRLRRPRLERDASGTAHIEGVGVMERVRIHTSSGPEDDLVRALVRLRGRPGTLLAVLHRTGEVVELEYGPVRAAGPWRADPERVVLSPRPRDGALYVPGLVNRTLVEFEVRESGRSTTYVLKPSAGLRLASAGEPPEDRALYLVDSDGDGAIDAWRGGSAAARPQAQARPAR